MVFNKSESCLSQIPRSLCMLFVSNTVLTHMFSAPVLNGIVVTLWLLLLLGQRLVIYF